MKRTPLRRGSVRLRTRKRLHAKGGRRFKRSVRLPEKLAWTAQQPCIAKDRGTLCVEILGRQVHHEPPLSRGGGDDRTLAVCVRHHAERHTLGKRAFERKYKLDLDVEAAATHASWQREQGGTP